MGLLRGTGVWTGLPGTRNPRAGELASGHSPCQPAPLSSESVHLSQNRVGGEAEAQGRAQGLPLAFSLVQRPLVPPSHWMLLITHEFGSRHVAQATRELPTRRAQSLCH